MSGVAGLGAAIPSSDGRTQVAPGAGAGDAFAFTQVFDRIASRATAGDGGPPSPRTGDAPPMVRGTSWLAQASLGPDPSSPPSAQESAQGPGQRSDQGTDQGQAGALCDGLAQQQAQNQLQAQILGSGPQFLPPVVTTGGTTGGDPGKDGPAASPVINGPIFGPAPGAISAVAIAGTSGAPTTSAALSSPIGGANAPTGRGPAAPGTASAGGGASAAAPGVGGASSLVGSVLGRDATAPVTGPPVGSGGTAVGGEGTALAASGAPGLVPSVPVPPVPVSPVAVPPVPVPPVPVPNTRPAAPAKDVLPALRASAGRPGGPRPAPPGSVAVGGTTTTAGAASTAGLPDRAKPGSTPGDAPVAAPAPVVADGGLAAPSGPLQQVLAALNGLAGNPAASDPSLTEGAAPPGTAAVPGDPAPTTGATAGPREVVIQLDPEHLGTVAIKLRMTGDKLDVQIEVANGRTLDILNRDRHLLSAAVEAAGKPGVAPSLVVASPDSREPGADVRPSGSHPQAGEGARQGSAFAAASDGRAGRREDRSAAPPSSTDTRDDSHDLPQGPRSRGAGGGLYV